MRRTAITLAALAPLLVAASAAATPKPPQFSTEWRALVPPRERVARVVGDDTLPLRLELRGRRFVDLDLGLEISGTLNVTFGDASDPAPIVVASYSENYALLDFGNLNDGSTDRFLPTAVGETWVGRKGCKFTFACSRGRRAFRYVRLSLLPRSGMENGWVEIAAAGGRTIATVPTADEYGGWFLSSDPLLNRIWYASAYTAQLVTDVSDPEWNDSRDCDASPGSVVVLDGARRDRCPWAGDLAVSGATLLASTRDPSPVAATLELLAAQRIGEGAIAAGPLLGGSLVLFDYPALWILALHDYVLWTGDVALARRVWPRVEDALARWYPRFAGADGLLANTLGHADYAFIRRGSQVVAYYNALYVLALRRGGELARWVGEDALATEWERLASRMQPAFDAAFWDEAAGLYRDATAGEPTHPQDGNAFAVLAGMAPPPRGAAALQALAARTRRPWGNAIADGNAWDSPADWGSAADQRVYPFMSYFEVLARFDAGLAESAVEQVRRTWGWMLQEPHDVSGTTWEAIGNFGSATGIHGRATSMAHGWSTGAAPALTQRVLGLRPTAPGWTTFDVAPSPADVRWAQGEARTPRGPVRVAWRREGGDSAIVLRVVVPAGTRARIALPRPWSRTSLVGPGDHVLVARRTGG